MTTSLSISLCATVALSGLEVSASARRPSCFGKRATIVGTRAADTIRGTNGPDVIVARGGDDVIVGKGGKDRICGGGGNDNIQAQNGNDLVRGQRGKDDIDGGPGSDHLDGDGGDDAIYGGDGDGTSDTLVGGEGNDDLDAGDGSFKNDFLFGGSAHDEMYGNDGSDTFFSGPDSIDDFIDGGDAVDSVDYAFIPSGLTIDLGRSEPQLGKNDDFISIEALEGTLYDDVIIGDAESNTLNGSDGDDTITSGAGNDVIDGGRGGDSLDGGEDRDRVAFTGSPSGVAVSLLQGIANGADDDSLAGFEDIRGSQYDDRLEGDDGPNVISGDLEIRGWGSDTMFGLGGDDTLYEPASGSDAGEGHDTCWDGDVASCESETHADQLTTIRISFPEQAQIYGRDGVNRVATEEVSGSFGGSPGHRVSLRLLTLDGCRWWSQSREALVVRPCGSPRWNRRIRITGSLPNGFFQASSLVVFSKTSKSVSSAVGFRIE